MKLFVCVLFLSVILTTDGITCYECAPCSFPLKELKTENCSSPNDHCITTGLGAQHKKRCGSKDTCQAFITCTSCKTDLCNGAKHVSTTSVFLLLLSSSLSPLFL